MKVGVAAKEVETKEEKPKSLRVIMTFDPETAYRLKSMAEAEDVPVGEVVRTLVVGGLSAYPRWGIEAADRRRAFKEQQRALLVNLHVWFSEQKWIMEQQIEQSNAFTGEPPSEDPT